MNSDKIKAILNHIVRDYLNDLIRKIDKRMKLNSTCSCELNGIRN